MDRWRWWRLRREAEDRIGARRPLLLGSQRRRRVGRWVDFAFRRVFPGDVGRCEHVAPRVTSDQVTSLQETSHQLTSVQEASLQEASAQDRVPGDVRLAASVQLAALKTGVQPPARVRP